MGSKGDCYENAVCECFHATLEKEVRRRVSELERALGRKTYELEIAEKLLREWE